ncbi:MAG: hypothetical protein Q7K55_06065 [Candidatus Levybacteria bacterium]|nr:hypothetical protein [Candidatus Levybacteria bacterium]
MSDTKYTEEEINWAIGELSKKHPERADREHAIKFLDTFGKFGNIIANKLVGDKKSSKLKRLPENSKALKESN